MFIWCVLSCLVGVLMCIGVRFVLFSMLVMLVWVPFVYAFVVLIVIGYVFLFLFFFVLLF